MVSVPIYPWILPLHRFEAVAALPILVLLQLPRAAKRHEILATCLEYPS